MESSGKRLIIKNTNLIFFVVACFHFLSYSGVCVGVVCVECVWVQEVVRGQREEGDYKSLKLSRFAWKALRPVICSMLPCSKKKN